MAGWLFFVFFLLTALYASFHVRNSQPANQPTFRAKPFAARRFSRLASSANQATTANLYGPRGRNCFSPPRRRGPGSRRSHPSAHAVRLFQLVTMKCSGLNQIIAVNNGSMAVGMLMMMMPLGRPNLTRSAQRRAVDSGCSQPQQIARSAMSTALQSHTSGPSEPVPHRRK